MPKKTSRSARTQQTTQKRQMAARPIGAAGSSFTLDNEEIDAPELDTTEPLEIPEEKIEVLPERPSTPLRPMMATTTSETMDRPARTGVRPVARRFTNPAAAKLPPISREKEYTFIRSDLITVAALTTLMIILLVVLALLLAK
jgi:hypothetical protein